MHVKGSVIDSTAGTATKEQLQVDELVRKETFRVLRPLHELGQLPSSALC